MMEGLYSLVRSLKNARSYELPQDPSAAYYSLLSHVMQKQHRTFVELLEANPTFDINFVCGRSNRTLLHMAANVGAYECLLYLLKKGARTDLVDKQGTTPLQVAARNGFTRAISRLLEYGADIEIRNNEGMTAIHWLASNGRTEVFPEIIKHVTTVDVKDDNEQTPLHVACMNGHLSTVLKLIELKADIEASNVSGCTPLYFSCRHGHSEIVTELLKRNASMSPNKDGEHPMDAAIKGGYSQVCYTLVAWNSNLMAAVLQSCQDPSVEVAKANKVLAYLMYKETAYRDHILLSVSKTLHSEGMKLLTPNSDYEEYSDRFLRNVHIMRYLLSCNPRSGSPSSHLDAHAGNESARLRLDSIISRTESSASEKLLNQYTIEPENVERINVELNGLWGVLDSWMGILQHEIRSSQSCSPVSEVEGETLDFLKAEASDLRNRASSVHSPRRRSITSHNSVNLERLRWSQPALQFSLMDPNISESRSMNDSPTDDALAGSTSQITLDDEDDGGRAEVAVSRTELVGSNWVDISDSSSSAEILTAPIGSVPQVPDSSTNNPDGSGSFSSSRESEHDDVRTSSLAGEESSASTIDVDVSGASTTTITLPALSVDTSLRCDTESPVDVERVMDMTGDRLCCLIHGYFLFCQSQSTWMKLKGKMSSFNKFIKKYEDVLLLLVSRKPQLIFEHFSFILESPILLAQFLPAIHCQPLADRQKWFYEQLHNRKEDNPGDDSNVLNIARESLLSTSCKILEGKEDSVLKENLSVRFVGEEGMGVGVTREWFDLLVKEILNPDCALFTLSSDGATFQPNSNSFVNPDHLSYFQFAGRVMGLALYHRHLITAYFTRSFYKHILGIPVSYKDVESIDPNYSKSLQWLLDNSIDSLGEGLGITFSVNTDVFGQTEEIELKPGGKSITVTDENKLEYVHLAADQRMTKAIRHQVFAFLKGFYEFVPHSLVSLFDEYELELLMCGIPDDLDLNDWKTNTTYQAGFAEDNPTIVWFWEVVEELSKEEQVKLLQFVTGTSRVPWGGFANLAGPSGSLFTIVRTDSSVESLPTASTCFNMIKIPEYTSKEDLRSKLRTAISCGSQGFDFA